MVNQGPIPDEIPNNLQEQILLESAKSGNHKGIQGGAGDILADAPRLVANYGGAPEDWVKMSSTEKAVIEGALVQVHWFRNFQTGQDVEFKFKRQYPKRVPKS